MANRNQDIKTRLLATFRVEAAEHLQVIAANLLALERGSSPEQTREVVEATFREVHTLKGAARSVSLTDVEGLCRACESILSRITHDRLALTQSVVSGLEEAVDLVARLVSGDETVGTAHQLIERLEHAAAGPAPETATAAGAPMPAVETAVSPAAGLPFSGTIRLATATLDTLLLQAEELIVPKLAAGQRVGDAKALVEGLARCRSAFSRATGPQVVIPEVTKGLRALETSAREMLHQLTRDERTLSGAVGGLQERVRGARLTAASTVLDLFPRMVRDLARESGKPTEWVAQGTELEVDRKVLEEIKDPLIHLVRNAIDHGIEPPEVRAQAGKPPTGRIGVTFGVIEGNRIEIRVEDDGCGIDPVQVSEAAVRARLLTSEAAGSLTHEEALALIWRSGLSTSPIITDVSGHGLGLAIVKDRVERLGGQIQLETRHGSGTTVWMVLPASVATFRGLLVRAGGQSFLVPTEAVERAIRVTASEIEHVEGRAAICWNGRSLPLARLSDLLELAPAPALQAPGPDLQLPTPVRRQPCIVTTAGEESLGLLVEEIEGEREVLVKELTAPLVRIRNIAGAGLLGTGRVALILRPADLLKSARRSPRSAALASVAPKTKHQLRILVVDDSITTRTMEKNLLETAGYRVQVAVDGLEAWTLLKTEAFDLVVSDVDMPRMDGLDLTAKIRTDPKTADMPVVLVTALESREDKERGIEVGANAYLVKSSFDQTNLLEIIRRLV
ncbi:MAG: hypothetical protein A3J29_20595 [Acidobacteria bacterium RIFCSPLOWO2_12_FULL_67_14b]|nr:MAG: hypothetical protein A3J29_20595 [Acidobacteria bacterium RIFCSPLOWO2_12_FULL_67_14b]